MLVLSRRETERVRLGDSIVVTIIRIGSDKVRLGIEAPSDVVVLRDELEPHATEIVVQSKGEDSEDSEGGETRVELPAA
ncbi:MAG: carbon storage regulator [Planctomycetales bacterium]|nr:carbon storage regulator [Planctomycetales bacterium]